MTETYLVEAKSSVFSDTSLAEADFDTDCQREFPSEAAAEDWVSDRMDPYSNAGTLSLHTAHPNDTSDVDAYLVFRPSQGVWVVDS